MSGVTTTKICSHFSNVLLYLASGNIALVFAAQMYRSSEIVGISMGILSGFTIVFSIRSVDRSLFSRLIRPLSKIELFSPTIMVSNTTYAALAGRDSEMESLWSYKGDHNLTDCGTEIYNLTRSRQREE